MLRLLTAAAVAALVAAPASAQSIHISTAGKSADQVKLEVARAADRLCAVQTNGASFPIDAQRSCVAHTVNTTLAQAKDPALRLAQR